MRSLRSSNPPAPLQAAVPAAVSLARLLTKQRSPKLAGALSQCHCPKRRWGVSSPWWKLQLHRPPYLEYCEYFGLQIAQLPGLMKSCLWNQNLYERRDGMIYSSLLTTSCLPVGRANVDLPVVMHWICDLDHNYLAIRSRVA
jgi:hypothetical protein